MVVVKSIYLSIKSNLPSNYLHNMINTEDISFTLCFYKQCIVELSIALIMPATMCAGGETYLGYILTHNTEVIDNGKE